MFCCSLFFTQFRLQIFVQVFASGINTRTIYGFFRVSGAQGFKRLSSGLVVVQIAVNSLVTVQIAERLGQIADRIEHQRIVPSGQSERRGGEEVENPSNMSQVSVGVPCRDTREISFGGMHPLNSLLRSSQPPDTF